METEMDSYRMLFPVRRVGTVTNRVVQIKIHMVYAPIVRRHGRYHAVLLQQTVLQGDPCFEFLLPGAACRL
ncbi:MAG: hypothetical protein J6W70_00005, partial [Lentisphaeria bacterium]|nr:hypothetical protein [Lentisphaeria bacterium]